MKTTNKIKLFLIPMLMLGYCSLYSQSSLKSYSFLNDSVAEAGPVLLTNEGYFGSINTFKNGNGHYFIYKNDLFGNLLWSKEIAFSGINAIHDICANTDGQVFYIGDNLVADADYIVFSTNTNGALLWSTSIPKNTCNSYDESPKIKTDNYGNLLIITCTYEKTLVYKLNAAGLLVWSKEFYTDSITWENPSFDFEITPANGLLIIGRAKDDMCITNLDENGNLIYYNRYNDNDNYNTHPRVINKLSDGNYLIAGFRGENFSPYRFGFYLTKINPAGDVLDYRFYYDTSLTHMFIPYMICENQNGNIIIAGDGGYLSFAAFDSNLNLLKYEYYSPVTNVQTYPQSYTNNNNQLLVAFGDRDKHVFNFRASIDSLVCCGLNYATGFDYENVTYASSAINHVVVLSNGINNGANLPVLSSFTLPLPVLECGYPENYLGLSPIENKPEFSVYPNPVTRLGYLQVSGLLDSEFEYSIYSVDGKLVANAFTSNKTIAISTMERGNYLLVINSVSRRYTSVFTVQN